MNTITKKRSIKKLAQAILVVGALGTASVSMARDYYWLLGDDGKKHNQDLSDPWLWGNTTPGSVTSLEDTGTFWFRGSFGNVPIITSKSVSWGTICFSQNQYADFTGSLDLTQTNAAGEITGYASVIANNAMNIGRFEGKANLTLKAGTLGVSRTPTANPASWVGDGSGKKTVFTISGSNSVFQTGYAQRSIIGHWHPTVVTVCDGALYSGNFFIGQYGGTAQPLKERTLIVTGEGSRLEVPAENTAELVVGSTSGGSSLIVSNKASMTVSAALPVRIASHINNVTPGTHNRFVVTDGATFTSVHAVLAGCNSSSNLFEVSGGATATVAKVIRISEGAVEAAVPIYGNRILFKGTGTVVNAEGGLNGGYYGDNEAMVTVTDGATLNVAAGLENFMIGNYNCLNDGFEVLNCATVNVSKAGSSGSHFRLGGVNSRGSHALFDNSVFNAPGIYCDLGYDKGATGCFLTLRNGARVTLGEMFIGDYADHGALTVADSVLACTSLNFGLTGGKDHTFNLSGADTRISTGTFQFKNSTTWNFTMPETQPAEPIISCRVFRVGSPSVLNVTAEKQSCKKPVRLLHTTEKDIDDADLANLTVNLPNRYKLVRSADKRDLLIKPEFGTRLLLK